MDGFAFGNFGEKLDPGDATLIDIYGADTVCKRGTLSEDGTSCTIDLSIRKLIASHQSTAYGNAYGMAVASLRLYLGNNEQPSQFNPAVTVTHTGQLTLTNELNGYINRLSAGAYSMRKDVGTDSGYVRGRRPAEILARLRQQLQLAPDAADPFILLLYAREGASSLTLAPYQVVNLGNNLFDLYVYDSNFPGDNSRKVRFDLATASWSYSTTIASLGKSIDLSGDAASSPLPDLRQLSAHALRNLILLGTASAGSDAAGTRTLFDAGSPVAYQTENCHTLTIGAVVTVNAAAQNAEGACNAILNEGDYQSLAFSDGLSAEDNNRSHNRVYGIRDAGTYALQHRNGALSSDLAFNLTGNQGSGNMQLDFVTDQGDLAQVSAAPSAQTRAAGITDIGYVLTLSPDASNVSMTATSPAGADATISVNLGFAERGLTEAQPSVSVDVKNIQLASGQPLQTKIDGGTGLFTVKSDRPLVFALEIVKMAPDGAAAVFEQSRVVLDGVAAQLDFGSWEGGDTRLSLVVDQDGDGFANDAPQELENEYRPVRLFLPIISRDSVDPLDAPPIFLPMIMQLMMIMQQLILFPLISWQ